MQIPFEMSERIGLTALQALLEPLSPYGAEMARRLRLYSKGEESLLSAEWARVRAAMPCDVRALRHSLSALREVRGTVKRLSQEVLTEVELLELKNFLTAQCQIAELARTFPAFDDLGLAPLTEALAVLDPMGERASGFTVPVDISLLTAKRNVEATLRAYPKDTIAMAERARIVAQEVLALRVSRTILSKALAPFAEAIVGQTKALGQLDFTLQRAKVANQYGCGVPTWGDHYRMEGMTRPNEPTFTPLHLAVPLGGVTILGANMGGKSVALKTFSANVLWAMAGCLPFAMHAEIVLVDAIHLLFGEMESGTASAFGGEVVALSRMADDMEAGKVCLVVMDEPARGTNPGEGAALLSALLDFANAHGAYMLVSTHLDGVAQRAKTVYRAAILTPEGIQFGLHPVEPSAPVPREALSVARRMGLSETILQGMETYLSHERKTNPASLHEGGGS